MRAMRSLLSSTPRTGLRHLSARSVHCLDACCASGRTVRSIRDGRRHHPEHAPRPRRVFHSASPHMWPARAVRFLFPSDRARSSGYSSTDTFVRKFRQGCIQSVAFVSAPLTATVCKIPATCGYSTASPRAPDKALNTVRFARLFAAC